MLDYPNNFNDFISRDFLIKKEYGRYSLNPKKGDHWIFSSPMRYILSIRNNEIPIVTENFSDETPLHLYIKLNKNDIDANYLDSNYNNILNEMNLKIRKHNEAMLISYKDILENIKILY